MVAFAVREMSPVAVSSTLPVPPPIEVPEPRMKIPALVSVVPFPEREIAPLLLVMTVGVPPKSSIWMPGLLAPGPETPVTEILPSTVETRTSSKRWTPKLPEVAFPPVPWRVMFPIPVVVRLPLTLSPSWEEGAPTLPPACPVRKMWPPNEPIVEVLSRRIP